jgi:hypothetical protein
MNDGRLDANPGPPGISFQPPPRRRDEPPSPLQPASRRQSTAVHEVIRIIADSVDRD